MGALCCGTQEQEETEDAPGVQGAELQPSPGRAGTLQGLKVVQPLLPGQSPQGALHFPVAATGNGAVTPRPVAVRVIRTGSPMAGTQVTINGRVFERKELGSGSFGVGIGGKGMGGMPSMPMNPQMMGMGAMGKCVPNMNMPGAMGREACQCRCDQVQMKLQVWRCRGALQH